MIAYMGRKDGIGANGIRFVRLKKLENGTSVA